MTSVPIVYSPHYRVDIGTHVFPTEKYRLTLERLLHRGVLSSTDLVEPQPASWEQLSLVHTPEYLDKLRTGRLTVEEIAQLELPWSRQMVDGFRTMVGGTIEAARLAVSGKAACHLGGGLHHAFGNHGEGFCPFNDVAVAIRVLQQSGVERHAVVDLDVHHGNGTAFIFESDPRVFTCSLHQQHNYPLWKPRSSFDIGVPDGTHDGTYLPEVERALSAALASHPQCVFYLAGADPYEDDQLGGLRLTKAGLRQRDRTVIRGVMAAGIPLVVVLAGGYARRVEDTVEIHAATIEEAVDAGRPPAHRASDIER
jgi:acetoin utilization deacetylase AcuC-like enzyme